MTRRRISHGTCSKTNETNGSVGSAADWADTEGVELLTGNFMEMVREILLLSTKRQIAEKFVLSSQKVIDYGKKKMVVLEAPIDGLLSKV